MQADLQRQIAETIARHKLISPGSHLLLAVSGGSDSTGLVFLLQSWARDRDVTLSLIHLDHGLRGGASAADAAFVQSLAQRLGFPCTVERVQADTWATRRGISLEMAAREVRLEFYGRMLRVHGAEAVATAHTRDDQAETVLMRLLRGAGMQGLCGMAALKELGDVRIIRPLLDRTRVEITSYLREKGEDWCEDESNRDRRHLRNVIRHDILPELRVRVNPAVDEALIRTAGLLAEENRYLEASAQEELHRCRDPEQRPALGVDALQSLPAALLRRVYRRWLIEQGVTASAIDHDAVQRMEGLLCGPGGTREVSLQAGWRVVRANRLIRVGRNRGKEAAPFRCRLDVPGETALPEIGLRVCASHDCGFRREEPAGVGRIPSEGWVDSRQVEREEVYVRNWQRGDRILPVGFDGSVKLQDLYTNEKVPLEDRARLPVFECRGEVIWVPGYRVAENWSVRGPQAPSIRLRIEPL